MAVIVILALLIDDFLAFMRGDDSLLGELLEKFGIDANEIRDIIFDLWEVIKGILPFIKELAMEFGRGLVRALQLLLPILLDLLRQILPPIMQFLQRLIPLIANFARQLIPLIVGALEMLLPLLFRIIEAVLPVLINLIESLLPVIMTIIETVLPIVISLLETLLPIILQVIETILPVLLTLLDALIPIITFVAQLLGNVLGAAFEGLIPIINAFMQILGGIIDFIAGVFTGDWERAWEGIRNIFSGIISGLAGIFKLPINLIITRLNTFIRGLNRISIPDWVPGVGGMGINIPEIPMLAKGSDSSPDTFIAGEEGPELITNAKGSKVFTATETADVFGKLKALAKWKPNQEDSGTKAPGMFARFGDYVKGLFKKLGENAAPAIAQIAAPNVGATSANYAKDLAQTLKYVKDLSLNFVAPSGKKYAPGGNPDSYGKGIYQTLKGIATLITAPDDATVEAYYSSITNNHITVNQEVYNDFHGDRAGQERSAEAMDQATDDATEQLSRALAYVR